MNETKPEPTGMQDERTYEDHAERWAGDEDHAQNCEGCTEADWQYNDAQA